MNQVLQVYFSYTGYKGKKYNSTKKKSNCLFKGRVDDIQKNSVSLSQDCLHMALNMEVAANGANSAISANSYINVGGCGLLRQWRPSNVGRDSGE